MIRSALTALAFAVALILPMDQTRAQEAPVTHVVVAGETLALLADRYLGDYERWPEIARLNPQVTDPNQIAVGLELVMPPTSLRSTSDPQRRRAPMGQAESRRSELAHTVFASTDFRSRRSVQVEGEEAEPHLAVPIDVFYSAEWMEPGVDRPLGQGTLSDFVKMSEARRFQGLMARPFDQVMIERGEGFTPRDGEELQVFRVTRQVQGRGWIVKPTGSVTVIRNEDGSTVAQVNRQFAPMALGDHVRAVPEFPLRRGQVAHDVELGSMSAHIVEWGEPHQLPQFGDVAILDAGTRDGVSVGDEFVVAARTGQGFSPNIAGRLQVIGTGETVSSARILQMDGPVFSLGTEVFLARKMR